VFRVCPESYRDIENDAKQQVLIDMTFDRACVVTFLLIRDNGGSITPNPSNSFALLARFFFLFFFFPLHFFHLI